MVRLGLIAIACELARERRQPACSNRPNAYCGRSHLTKCSTYSRKEKPDRPQTQQHAALPVAQPPPLRVLQSARAPAAVPTLCPIHHAKALWHTSLGLKSRPPAGLQSLMGTRSVPSKARTLGAGMPPGRVSGCGRRPRICPRPRRSPCGFSAVWTRPRRRWSESLAPERLLPPHIFKPFGPLALDT